MTDLDLINLIELLDRANDKGIRVSFDEVQDELMILIHQHGEPDQQLLQDLKLHKQALKEYLSKSRQHALIKDAARQIAVINRNDMERLPLSFSQERLWFIDRLQGTLHYHIPLVLHLGTGVDVQALEFAFNAIITRHEILRTVIKEEDGKAYQVIMDAACWRMNCIHWEQQPAALQAYIEQLVTAPFDLAADFMIKAWLVKTPGGQFTLALVMHHIASDGWSVQILMKELMELYISRREGRQPALRPLPVQYADYALWQRRYLSEKIMAEKLLYWKVQLKDVEPLELPADHARRPEQSIKGRAVGRSAGSGLMKNLHTLGAQQGTTLFMTLLAAFKVLLYRYSGQTDICVGSPVAGRQQQELEGLIGFFVNTLALRSNVNGHTPFTAFLDEVKQTTLSAYENQEVPFDKIVEALAIERDVRRHPVFQVLFSIQHRPSGAGKESEELQLMPEKLTQHFSQYDISLDIVEANDGLHMVLTYCSDLFEQHTMIRMLDHYEQLLNAIIKDPEQPIAQMQMMSDEEMQLVKSGFNSSAAEYRRGATFIELFEEQAERTPALTAVIDNRDALSYRQLHERSGLLASYLRTRGVKEGTLVPVCIERSTGMLVALLAVLKAGGAYVPVDGEYPIERIAFMLQDTAATLVLTTTRYRNRFTENMAAEIICLDEWDHTAAPPAKPADSPVLSASRLAYVIYTSGSTGKPKGVMIAHDALLNFLTSMSRLLQMNERHTMLAVTTCSFDISGLELYVPLLSGSKVYITGNDDVKDGHKLQALLSIAAATHMQATPATWQLLLESGWQNREQITILTGGEAVPEKLKDELVSLTGRCVWNCYGPTETTIWSTVKQLNANEKVNIGAPIANTQVYILNDEQLCPIGIPGELCIGGNGLAKGYLNNPALTDEKFVKNFFGSGKLYRTGDLAKWLPNGNIAYLGRLDNQVKIRGYRIETGEVETVLNQAPGVKQAAVVAVKDNAGSNRLVAYLQVEAAYEQHTVYTWLRTHLPEYMLPAVLLTIEQLPLTPNGKVNRKKLAGMKLEAPQGRTFVAPRYETEVKLAEIWSALLDVDTIGVHDNFFEVGGHSLMAMRVVAAVRKQFNIELNVRDLFVHPTIAALALMVKEFPGGAALPPVVHHAGRNEFPLSFSQERLWFINRLQGSVQYHLPYFLKLQGELDIHALEAAFKAVLARHAVLRSVICETDGMLRQQIKEMTHWQLETILPGQAGGGQKMANDGIARFVNRPFDLSADCMLRAALFTVTANEYVLVVVLHHIAADGWSMAIFITEMMELYNSIREMRPPVVQPLPVQYADYALWQREALAGTVLEAGLQYWRQQLQELEPFELLTDYQRPPDTSTLGAVESRLLEQELANALVSLSRQAGATLFMTMLAAFKLLLYRYSGQKDIAVGSPTAGRQLQEVEGLIGCFVNNLVLRSHIHDDLSFMELLEQVKETTLGAYEHQHIPFEKVVEALGVQRDISRHPLFQIMFSLMNTPAATTQETTGLNLNGYDGGIVHAKYDLNIEISTVGNGLSVVMTYGSDLFTPATIRQLLSHYRQLLYSIVTNPFVSIGKLALLQEEEERQLLHGFNATAAKVEPATIIDLFAKQAALNPDAIAVVYENQSLSYRQLDERSNQLAHYLRHKGVKEETLVPICIDRSLNMIIGLLGILKAGGAYVPVDPAYPTGRIANLLSDTAATIAVSIQACEDRFEHTGIQTLVCLDSHSAQIEACAPTPPSTKLKPGNLSYVIYTSGSTGRPKGVMNEHGGVVNRLRWTQHCFALNATDAVLQKTTFCFDVSVWELFWPLISGAKLVFATPDGQKDPQYIKDIIRAQQITTIHFVPSMLSVFLESVEAGEALPLQRVLCSGEALQLSHVREFRRKLGNTGLHNLYGPTEAAIEVSYWEVPLQVNDLHVIPIGRPVWNTQLYILDAAQRLLPPAAAGELYIGGVQVARGYLNRQELTEERFIPNPFGAGRLYRTGDLARWLPDGTIEYLGRIDDQVKIRGYRIEPGEVENVLQGAPGIKQAAVAVAGSSEEDKRLVGFIVTEESYVKETVLTYLYNTLPAYMIPAQLIPVSSIPFTASGKVNRKQLPKPEGANATGKVYVPPGNELEAGLIEIWKGLLKTDHIGINDNFFELGGHSLMAFRLVLAITKKWDITIPLKAIFQLPDIKSLAATVSALLHLNNDVAIIEDEEEITL